MLKVDMWYDSDVAMWFAVIRDSRYNNEVIAAVEGLSFTILLSQIDRELTKQAKHLQLVGF
jgi:hypothetical protein